MNKILSFIRPPFSIKKTLWITAAGLFCLTFVQAANSQSDGSEQLPWKVICDADNRNARTPAEGCRMSQTLVTNDTLKPVLTARVFPGKSPTLLLTVPLNVFLKPGLRLAIDKRATRNHAFEICNIDGCHTGIPLGKKLLNSLKRGEFARFAFQDGTGKEIILPISLKGFTKSWKELSETYAKLP